MSSGIFYFVILCIERLSQTWIYVILAVIVAGVYILSEEASRRHVVSCDQSMTNGVFHCSVLKKSELQAGTSSEGTKFQKSFSKLDTSCTGGSVPSIPTSSVFPQFQPLRTSTSISVINFQSGIC
uniref:Transmembrane protein n=1 Tax=Syphacia muris TaxID=451379 RepID=A0A0N5ABK4_9BILA